jgi:transcriptional regulator with XRE-family HTH domain
MSQGHELAHDWRANEPRPANDQRLHATTLARMACSLHGALVPQRTNAYSRKSRHMSVEQIGKALTQARTARGLTLPDVERDTRISAKYLEALEHGQLDVLPAPVYARAFMRTYSQYLGLNAREFVAEMPGARPEAELPPLPDVAREGLVPLVTPSWVVAGVVIIVVVIAGLFVFWNRGDDSAPSVVTEGPRTERPVGGGSDNPSAGNGGQPIEVTQGEAPDVRGQPALLGIHAISEAGLRFFIIEVENGDVAPETIFQQSPSPGTSVDSGSTVTVMISR